MTDALNAWWAQQLLLCDWAVTSHPLAVDAGAAEQRLLQLGITGRGELAEQLFHGLGAPAGRADRLLGGLEWAALAGAAPGGAGGLADEVGVGASFNTSYCQ